MNLQQLKQIITIAECSSMNEAAKKLFISQPSLSNMVKELEKEVGVKLFLRSNRGIIITSEGKEFLGYAKQITEQYRLLEDRYFSDIKKKSFSISMQHYSFAVKAFIEIINEVGMEEYKFSIYETKTYEVIENIKNFKSEIGIIYINDFNERIIKKIFKENNLEFKELFTCDTYVYLWDKHPLAEEKIISLKDLEDYPCMVFEQGKNNSFYLAEEMKSTYEYKNVIKVDDRATMQNLIIGLNGYTLCSGIICKDLNEDCYKTIPLKESDKIKIGYIKRQDVKISEIGSMYIQKLKKYDKAGYKI